MKITSLEVFGIDDRILAAWEESGHRELLPIQELAVCRGKVLEGGSAVVFSPTSSGKTFIGEMAAVQTARRNMRAVYLVPQKALAEEKYRQFKTRYAPFDVQVVISTRDRKEYDRAIHRGDFQIAVIVYEKFQALMVASPSLLRNVGLIVIDELQMIGDQTRGAALEILLTKILLAEDRPQVIGLSAVLGDAQALADWFGAALCEDRRRPVELRKGVLYDGAFRYAEHNSHEEAAELVAEGMGGFQPSVEALLAEVNRCVRRGEQCLVFHKSREECVQAAARIAEIIPAGPASGALEELSHLEDSQGKDILTGLLRCGVAYHNADLDWDQRDVIERWFRKGEIKALCATSTLAMGINLPARNVFVDPNRWEHDSRGGWVTVPISQAEYENISGRAGRLGLENEYGRAVIIAGSRFQADTYYNVFVKGELGGVKPTLDSSPLAHHILNLVASGLCRTQDELRDILLASYTGRLLWRGGKREPVFLERLKTGVDRCLTGGLMENAADGLNATPLGTIAAAKGITVGTAIEIAAFARAHAGVAMTVDPLEVLWHLAGTECGGDIYISLSGPEYESREYQALLDEKVHDLSSAPRGRMEEATGGAATTYDATKRAKKALLLHEWVSGGSTRDIETRFRSYCGSIRGLAEEFAWLAETLAGMAKILGWPEEEVERLETLSQQLIHGIPAEGLELAALRVRGLGRSRICGLVRKGLTNLDVILALPLDTLQKFVTRPVAQRLLLLPEDVVEAEAPVVSPPTAQVGTDDESADMADPAQEPSENSGITYTSNVALHIDGRSRRRRHLVKCDDREVWLTERSFETALKLAVAARTTPMGWLAATDLGGIDSYRQVVRRLKLDLDACGVDADSLIENSQAKQYRLSVPPANVTVDCRMVAQHFSGADRALGALESA